LPPFLPRQAIGTALPSPLPWDPPLQRCSRAGACVHRPSGSRGPRPPRVRRRGADVTPVNTREEPTMSSAISNVRPDPDKVLVDIADYVTGYEIASAEAYETARYCLMDTLGCGLEALSYPACTKLMGPIVPGTIVPNGARVPGT